MAANDFDLLPTSSGLGIGYELQMSRAISKIANPSLKPKDPLPKRRLFEVHIGEDLLITYPTYTLPTHRFLTAKYLPLRSISFELTSPYDLPNNREEAVVFLDEQLPSMFIRDPAYGLGVTTLIAPLISVISGVPKVEHLVFDGGSTRIEGNTFHLSYDDYEDLRLGFGRVARKFQQESRIERTILANDLLLHPLDPSFFPLRGRPYVVGTVHKVLGGPDLHRTTLRGRDRVAVAQAAAINARSLAEKTPAEFAQLLQSVELVSLDKLIEQFEALSRENATETRWQKLFELNPFILSMVFGYPVVLVASSASMGGFKFCGGGDKIADFLLKNDRTQNAAIVEIKRPATEIVGTEYRSGVWQPHSKITGAIIQVLDQRAKFIKSLPQLKDNSGYHEIEAHAVDCVVLIGRTPDGKDKRASFELFRNQLKDVRVVTFDELLAKLILLRELLAGHSSFGDKLTHGEAQATET